MLVRLFFTLSGNGFGPVFLRRNRIRLPLTVAIIVTSFSLSINISERVNQRLEKALAGEEAAVRCY